jgi:FKBP-type peptidyl-prolyl cis-trans isomerase
MRLTYFFVAAAGLMLTFIACKGNDKSGYTFETHVKGKGAKPKSGDIATIEAVIYADSNMVFDSKLAGQPIEIPVGDPALTNPLQRPFAEGLLRMSVGDSISVIWKTDTVTQLPPDLLGTKVLRYSLKLVSVADSASFTQKRQEEENRMQAIYEEADEKFKAVAADSTKYKGMSASVKATTLATMKKMLDGSMPDMKTTGSGIKYVLVRAGAGEPGGGKDGLAVTHYWGCTTRGEGFDESYKRGQPLPVELGKGRVISGWEELLRDVLPEGCAAVAILPSSLAYGQTPPKESPIKPGDDLVFYLEPVKYIRSK